MKPTHYIYFLLNGRTVIYIGCSLNVPSRIMYHKYEKMHDNVRIMGPFSRAFAFKNETRWIKKFKPQFNKALDNKSGRKKIDESKKIVLVGFYTKKEVVDASGGMDKCRELSKDYIEGRAAELYGLLP